MGRSTVLVLSVCAAIGVLALAAPSSSTSCVRTVNAAAPAPPATTAEQALVLALAAANASGCSDWRVELTGTFLLDDSLEWAAPIPLHLIGPEGGMARLEGRVGDHRILTLGATAGTAPITLERLVLTGGDVSREAFPEDAGGAVSAHTLHLIDVELIGNSAVVGGAVSTVDLTATRTTFFSNNATLGDGLGGAVDALRDVTLTNVTFVGNTAKSGGALHLDATILGPVSLRATNVTFRGNVADVLTEGADLQLTGVAADMTVTLRGVLFAGVGVASAGDGCSMPALGSWLTVEASLAADGTCGVPVDATLAGLTYDTVPFRTGTQNLVLPSGTWAGLDAYACDPDAGWPATDQRGLPRPQGATARCDIGAVEREVVATPTPIPAPGPDPADVADPTASVSGLVPRAVPAGGGGCADGCPPSEATSGARLSPRAGAPAPPR